MILFIELIVEVQHFSFQTFIMKVLKHFISFGSVISNLRDVISVCWKIKQTNNEPAISSFTIFWLNIKY